MTNENVNAAEAMASSAIASGAAAMAAAKASKLAAKSARMAHERLTRIEVRQNRAEREQKKVSKKLDKILSNQATTMGLAKRVTVIEQAKRNYDVIKEMARGGWLTLKVLAVITLIVAALAALGFKTTVESILNFISR